MRQNTLGMLKCVESRASKLFTKRCIRSNLQVKAAQFFFSSVYVALLSTTRYKLLYSSRIRISRMFYLATQQQNKLIEFPVCAKVGLLLSLDILLQACEKHIHTRFSLQQFRFFSITQPQMLCHVSVHSGDRAKISVAFFDQIALFSDFNHLFESLEPGFSPYSSSTFYILDLSSKKILTTLTANFMNNFYVVNSCCSQKV